MGESWNEQVGHRASTQAGLLAKKSLETGNKWTGDAADSYGKVITAQREALTEIKAITDILQTALNEIAGTLSGFWHGILTAFAVYVAGMIAIYVQACSAVQASSRR